MAYRGSPRYRVFGGHHHADRGPPRRARTERDAWAFLALLALDLPRDSEILIPAFTFFASASAAVFAGLRPVFVDADPDTFNLDVEALEPLMTESTRAIMPVGVYGHSPPMDRISDFAAQHGLVVLEDAAQCLGVTYRGRHAGTWGDAGVISFFADKTVTTGEGGVVLTDDDELYHRLRLLRNQGRRHSGTFVHEGLGMNFRVTDMQCAVGTAQLRKLPRIADRKRETIAAMRPISVTCPAFGSSTSRTAPRMCRSVFRCSPTGVLMS